MSLDYRPLTICNLLLTPFRANSLKLQSNVLYESARYHTNTRIRCSLFISAFWHNLIVRKKLEASITLIPFVILRRLSHAIGTRTPCLVADNIMVEEMEHYEKINLLWPHWFQYTRKAQFHSYLMKVLLSLLNQFFWVFLLCI